MSSNETPDHRRWISSVVDQYEGALVRYATQITGDIERGRDVVQDAFLRLCKQDPEQLDGHLREWLYTVCRNRALDIRRKEVRMKTMTSEQAVTVDDNTDRYSSLPVSPSIAIIMIHQCDEISKSDLIKLIICYRLWITRHNVIIPFCHVRSSDTRTHTLRWNDCCYRNFDLTIS